MLGNRCWAAIAAAAGAGLQCAGIMKAAGVLCRHEQKSCSQQHELRTPQQLSSGSRGDRHFGRALGACCKFKSTISRVRKLQAVLHIMCHATATSRDLVTPHHAAMRAALQGLPHNHAGLQPLVQHTVKLPHAILQARAGTLREAVDDRACRLRHAVLKDRRNHSYKSTHSTLKSMPYTSAPCSSSTDRVGRPPLQAA